MKVSRAIEELQIILFDYGDKELFIYCDDCCLTSKTQGVCTSIEEPDKVFILNSPKNE